MEVELAIAPPKSGRGRSRKANKSEDEDVGAQAEMEAEGPAALQVGKSEATRSSPSSGPSNRGRSKLPDTSATIAQIENIKQRTPAKRKSESALNQPREESEKEDEPPKSERKRPKTPRSDNSAFSDYNPFQSGGEDAREREKRRRKVGRSPRSRLTTVIHWCISRHKTASPFGTGSANAAPRRAQSRKPQNASKGDSGCAPRRTACCQGKQPNNPPKGQSDC